MALLGPRQCGKTTLARTLVSEEHINYFDLEDPRTLQRLADPMLALGALRGTVVLDEIQRRPDIFPMLRVLADRPRTPARFLILGSASPDLLRQSSESLAGRIEYIYMQGFSTQEVGADAVDKHWLRGGFPRSYLARTDTDSLAWRRHFIRSFVERDLPAFGHDIDGLALQRLWAMAAHYHGQILNTSNLARSLAISDQSVRRYIQLLEGFFLLRTLKPWHSNLRKREVKAPKLYFADSGLLHAQLGLITRAELVRHPALGASWEGYALTQTIRTHRDCEAYFWAAHSGAELDLILRHGDRMVGVEFKHSDAPQLSAAQYGLVSELGLDHLYAVYPQGHRYPMAQNVTAVPLGEWLMAGPWLPARVSRPRRKPKRELP